MLPTTKLFCPLPFRCNFPLKELTTRNGHKTIIFLDSSKEESYKQFRNQNKDGVCCGQILTAKNPFMIYEFLVVCLFCANITPTYYYFSERSSSAALYCLKLQGTVWGGVGLALVINHIFLRQLAMIVILRKDLQRRNIFAPPPPPLRARK